MICRTYSTWLRCTGVICACAALVFTGLGSWSASAAPAQQQKLVATPGKQQISETIRNLKNSENRWIEVDLSEQQLVAWEGGKRIYSMITSTGKRSTPTLTGVFAVQTKLRTTQMQGEDYNVPDVPYVMYYDGGYAIHGAYWHSNFGTPVSHGCVNLTVKQARRLFNWASVGTPVVVHQ
jgi:lipoprotein-anchoring transpeptidase ErfK/SrfK